MTAQLTLWEGAARRRSRIPDTQSDGLRDVMERAPNQERVVLAVLRGHGPMTRNELAEATRLPLASVCRCVTSMLKSRAVLEVREASGALVRKGKRSIVQASYETRGTAE